MGLLAASPHIRRGFKPESDFTVNVMSAKWTCHQGQQI